MHITKYRMKMAGVIFKKYLNDQSVPNVFARVYWAFMSARWYLVFPKGSFKTD